MFAVPPFEMDTSMQATLKPSLEATSIETLKTRFPSHSIPGFIFTLPEQRSDWLNWSQKQSLPGHCTELV